MASGAAFDFAVNISRATRQGVDYLEKKMSAIASVIGQATRKGKTFVTSFLDRVDSATRRKGGFFDRIRQEHLKKFNRDLNDTGGRLSLVSNGITRLSIGFSAFQRNTFILTAALYSLVGAFTKVGEVSDEVVNNAKKGMFAFGSYSASLNRYRAIQADIISGKLRGESADLQKASADLVMMGAKGQKGILQAANNLARLQGTATSDVVSKMASFAEGDLNAFDEVFGKGRLAKKYGALTGNPRALTAAIAHELSSNKAILDAANKIPTTFSELWIQMKESSKRFMQAVFGDTGDINSFASMVMRSFQSVITFLNSNAVALKKVAGFIQAMFMGIWKSVTMVFNGLIKPLFEKFFGFVNKSLTRYKDVVAGVLLYTALVTQEIVAFFQKYGKYILGAIALVKLWGLSMYLLKIPGKIIDSVGTYFFRLNDRITDTRLRLMYMQDTAKRVFASMGKYIGQFITALRTSTVAQWALNIAMNANPIGLIIAGVVALGAAIYLVIKYWDQIKSSISGVSDTVLLLVGRFFPVIGIVLTLIKYWGEFKRIFQNVWAIVYNTFMGVFFYLQNKITAVKEWFSSLWTSIVSGVTEFLAPIGQFFSDLWSSVYDTIPDWLKDFGGFIYSSLTSIGSKIGGWFKSLWAKIKLPNWMKDVLDWIGGATEKAANQTGTWAERQARAAGNKDFKAKKGAPIVSPKTVPSKPVVKNSPTVTTNSPTTVKTPLVTPTPSTPTVSSVPMGGDTVNNSITINVPQGMTAAEIEKIVKKVISKQAADANLRNN